MPDLVREVLAAYPQIYHACHLRHPRRRTSPAALSARESWILGHLGLDQPVSAGDVIAEIACGRTTIAGGGGGTRGERSAALWSY